LEISLLILELSSDLSEEDSSRAVFFFYFEDFETGFSNSFILKVKPSR
jgi:hypothetical protein